VKEFIDEEYEREKEAKEAYEMGLTLKQYQEMKKQLHKQTRIDSDGVLLLSDELSEDDEPANL